MVAKFGGSSLANAAQFSKVKKIVESNPFRKVIVVSAVGKENPNDNKITDLLYLLSAHIRYKVDGTHLWDEVFERYQNIKEALNLKLDIKKEIEIIKQNLKLKYD